MPLRDVLIADDNGEILAECLDAVDKDGRFRITTAETPEQCLALFDERHFDAVVLDLSFTAQNREGLDLITEIKSRRPCASIIILSGLDDQATMLDATRRGAARFLSKNLHDINEIAERISQVLVAQESDDSFAKEGIVIARQVGAAFRSSAMSDVFQLVAKAPGFGNVVA